MFCFRFHSRGKLRHLRNLCKPLHITLLLITVSCFGVAQSKLGPSQQKFCDAYEQYLKDVDKVSMLTPLEKASEGVKDVTEAPYAQRFWNEIHDVGDTLSDWVGLLSGNPDPISGGARLQFSFVCRPAPGRAEFQRAGLQLQTPYKNEQWPKWNAMIGNAANGYRLQSPIIQMLSHLPRNNSDARITAHLYWLEKGSDENPNPFGVFGDHQGKAVSGLSGTFGATITSVQLGPRQAARSKFQRSNRPFVGVVTLG